MARPVIGCWFCAGTPVDLRHPPASPVCERCRGVIGAFRDWLRRQPA